ncbi:3-oxoacyl-[acyl-carrier-protein] reductase [Monosporozyma unispora]
MQSVMLPVAIITGSTGHIGLEVVKKLSQEGFSCICLGSKLSPVVELPLQYNVAPGQRHSYLALDLGQPLTRDINKLLLPGLNYNSRESVPQQQEMSIFQHKHWGHTYDYKLQLLVNIAGISQTKMSIKMTPEEITRMININLLNPLILSQVVAKQMYRESLRAVGNNNGASPHSNIINVSSILGDLEETDIPGTSIYSATKAGLTQYSHLFDNELRHSPHWPRIKCISPGPVVDSAMVQRLSESTQTHLIERGLRTNSLTTTQEVAAKIWELYLSA